MAFNHRKLRHRIDIERKTTKQDQDTGENRELWETFLKDVPAEIAPLSAREFIQSQAVQGAITARITIRYHAGLDSSMRIVHTATGKIYNPQGWLPDPDSGIHWLTAPCSEGVNQG